MNDIKLSSSCISADESTCFLAQVTPSVPLGFPQGAIQKAPEHLGELGIGAQQLLFAGAFRQAHFMRGPFQRAQPTTVICTCFLFAFWFSETLGCTWVPFANYSLQPAPLLKEELKNLNRDLLGRARFTQMSRKSEDYIMYSRCNKVSALRVLVHTSHMETRPPEKGEAGAGDGEKKVSLNVFTISSRKTKQGFVYNAGTAEGQEEKGTGRMMPLGESTRIKHLSSQSTRNHFRSHFRREPLYHHWPFKVEIPSAGGARYKRGSLMCRADVQDTAHPAGRAQGDCRRVQKEHTAPDEEGKVKSTDFQEGQQQLSFKALMRPPASADQQLPANRCHCCHTVMLEAEPFLLSSRRASSLAPRAFLCGALQVASPALSLLEPELQLGRVWASSPAVLLPIIASKLQYFTNYNDNGFLKVRTEVQPPQALQDR
ncbi:hypothetical protein Anapl_03677 [Anas platyrhynchos]|uniref:Uncharacterized protein n=1 Tax=Anas platyrhynchos TaxID=8839 RepID=R0M1D8_ANAPL|nr:hypothetical protein Anapl_03677 [Anas platyrhynchos]